MNSVNRFRPAKQFRCLPLVGKDAQFGYVEIINNAADGGNYQPADLMVEAFVQMNEKGREEWLKLTEGSKTTEGSPFGLSGGSLKRGVLSTCEQGMSTNASAHLSISGKSSGR